MNARRNHLLAVAAASVVAALGSPAPGQILSGLEVHYAFENSSNFGENSANPSSPGIPYG